MSNDTLANAAKMVELQEELAALKAENERLIAQQNAKVTVKPSVYDDGSLKGGVSVYGLQQFPVTLFPEQWERLFAAKQTIMDVCNRGDVRKAAAITKAEKKAARAAKTNSGGQA